MERHSKDRVTEGERREDKRKDKEGEMERFGWLGLREDREPGAVLQQKVKHFHKSALVEFTCSGGRLKSRHAWLVEREKPIPDAGGHLHRRNTCASSLHFPHRAVCSITIPRADAGRMSSFPLHSQAECTKIQRREKHNKFRLKLECLQAVKWRMNSGDLMEEECVRACVGKVVTSQKREKRRSTAPFLHLNSTSPLKSIYSKYYPQGCCDWWLLHLK